MGAIYHEAQVTLIAAAGTDATYGLPGLTQDLKNPCSCTVSRTVRQFHTKGSAIQSIIDSTWYTRGWTFQEGFMSRRRMYFTDVGVLYVCDEDRHSASLVNIAASLRNTSESSSFRDNEQIMREYTRRNLTHDHDALNAIVGALETQSKYHIWGVIISQNIDGTCVFLHWRHSSPVPRREEFPSWSPIGWRGQVDYSHHKPPFSYDCRIEIWQDGNYRPPAQRFTVSRRSNHIAGGQQSKFLKVTATMVMLEFEYIKDRHRANLYAKVAYSSTLYLYVLPSWDTDLAVKSGPGKRNIRLPCVMIRLQRRTTWGKDARPTFANEMQALILKQHDAYYERVGCFSWDEDITKTFARDQQGQEFVHHELRHQLREHGNGTFWLRDGFRTTFLLG